MKARVEGSKQLRTRAGTYLHTSFSGPFLPDRLRSLSKLEFPDASGSHCPLGMYEIVSGISQFTCLRDVQNLSRKSATKLPIQSFASTLAQYFSLFRCFRGRSYFQIYVSPSSGMLDSVSEQISLLRLQDYT
jgi:hypothetical protein